MRISDALVEKLLVDANKLTNQQLVILTLTYQLRFVTTKHILSNYQIGKISLVHSTLCQHITKRLPEL